VPSLAGVQRLEEKQHEALVAFVLWQHQTSSTSLACIASLTCARKQDFRACTESPFWHGAAEVALTKPGCRSSRCSKKGRVVVTKGLTVKESACHRMNRHCTAPSRLFDKSRVAKCLCRCIQCCLETLGIPLGSGNIEITEDQLFGAPPEALDYSQRPHLPDHFLFLSFISSLLALLDNTLLPSQQFLRTPA
jgi:hypothetical protein